MMRKNANLLLICFVLCTWFGAMFTMTLPKIMAQNITEEEMLLIDTMQENQSVSEIDYIKMALIEEVENYAYGKYAKTHKTIPTSIVEHGLKNEVDIMFIMAQTQVETSFGTTGAGRETSRRSLFGVINKKYTSYDKAIEDYVQILKKNYLTKGRTEQHLLKKYTTKGGSRYAEDLSYEVKLSDAYNKIKSSTKIHELQKAYFIKIEENMLCQNNNGG